MRGRIDFLVAVRRLVGEWLSLVEHLVRDQGVGGSNPLSPTNYLEETSRLKNFLQRPISLWFWIVSNPIRVVD